MHKSTLRSIHIFFWHIIPPTENILHIFTIAFRWKSHKFVKFWENKFENFVRVKMVWPFNRWLSDYIVQKILRCIFRYDNKEVGMQIHILINRWNVFMNNCRSCLEYIDEVYCSKAVEDRSLLDSIVLNLPLPLLNMMRCLIAILLLCLF